MRVRIRDREVSGIRAGMRMGLGVLFAVAVAVAGRASAEDVQSVEAVGTYGIVEKMRSSIIARDEAVEQGILEGVSRVATQLLEESGSDADLDAIRSALGADVLPYTRSFRILEDKGEGPARFTRKPGVEREYVVLVEAIVDVGRVKSALASKGLLESGGLDSFVGRGEPILVELVGIARYPAFEGVREALRSRAGATRVETLGFARNRQLLSVEGPLEPRELYSALADLESGNLRLRAVGVDEADRRVRFEGIEAP